MEKSVLLQLTEAASVGNIIQQYNVLTVTHSSYNYF